MTAYTLNVTKLAIPVVINNLPFPRGVTSYKINTVVLAAYNRWAENNTNGLHITYRRYQP